MREIPEGRPINSLLGCLFLSECGEDCRMKTKRTSIPPGCLDHRQAARLLQTNERTLRLWRAKQNLPYFKRGKVIFYKEKDLLDWSQDCTIAINPRISQAA